MKEEGLERLQRDESVTTEDETEVKTEDKTEVTARKRAGHGKATATVVLLD